MAEDCARVRADLMKYMARELPPERRRAVGQHLDRCDACAAEYRRLRELETDLRMTLPGLGQPHRPAIARLWGDVQQQMRRRRAPRPVRKRYGAAGALLMLALLLPLGMSQPPVYAVPEPPTPIAADAITSVPTVVAFATPTSRIAPSALIINITPGFASNDAPAASTVTP